MLIKCEYSADGDFTVGKVYEAYVDGTEAGKTMLSVRGNKGYMQSVPLDGWLWKFSEVRLEDMLIRYAEATPEQFEEIFNILHIAGNNYWRGVEHYVGLISSDKKNKHICYFSSHAGLDGIDNPDFYSGKASAYVTVGQFITALKQHYDIGNSEKEATPRYHRARQAPPKRTVTIATIYYEDGSTYTLKNVEKVVCYCGNVSIFGRNTVAEGIEDSHLVKINARHVRNIVVKSPHQVTQVEKDFNQPDKWNIYREDEQIFRAEQVDIKA